MIGKTIHEVGHAGKNTFFIRAEDNETHIFSSPLGGGWTRKLYGWGNPVARKETVHNTTYFIDESDEPIIGFIGVGQVDLCNLGLSMSRAEQIAREHKDLPTVTERAVRERVAAEIEAKAVDLAADAVRHIEKEAR